MIEAAERVKRAIRKNEPLVPLLDEFLTSPKKKANPLISLALKFFGEEEIKQLVADTIKRELPKYLGQGASQEVFQLLNTKDGRKFLHYNLDALLSYITSPKYRGNTPHTCPGCGAEFIGKLYLCPQCEVELTWSNKR